MKSSVGKIDVDEQAWLVDDEHKTVNVKQGRKKMNIRRYETEQLTNSR
jgi:hypothetical protein